MRRRRARAALSAALLAVAPAAAASTNVLSGRLGFSNANPEILALLGPPGNGGLSSFRLTATCDAPFSTHDLADAASDPIRSPWSLAVESSPAGQAYRIVASAQLGSGPLKDDYYFLPVTSPPVLDEPAPPAVADVLECAGVIRVRFVDEAGAPVQARGDRITADSSAGGASPLAPIVPGADHEDVIVRGDGSTYFVRAEITSGTDPFSDRLTVQRTARVVVACDEIVDIPMVLTLPGSAELGRIVGRLDVIGEDEIVSAGSPANTRSVVEGAGPWRNVRAASLPATPSQGDWALEDLVASDAESPAVPWSVQAQAAFGSGRATATMTTPPIEIIVPPGETEDAGDAFVMVPARITGDVRLAAPPDRPGRPSLLRRAFRASDRDADRNGVPDDMARFYDSTCVAAYGRAPVVPGATRSALGAEGLASIDGDWDAEISELAGAYRIVIGNLFGEPGSYGSDALHLKLLDTRTPSDPASFVDARVDVDEPAGPWDLAGGDEASRDRAACLSEVTIDLRAPGDAPFYGPSATGTGSFAGTDFRGQDVAYAATLWWARGLPASSAAPATTGRTQMLLPQGEWTIEPSMFVPRPGGRDLVTLPPFDLTVGCRQALEVSSEARVSVETDVPACSATASLRVTGRALASASLAELRSRVNGGAPSILCSDCGTDVPFAFDAPLQPGFNVVRVEAQGAAGTLAAADVFTRRPGEASGLRVARDAAGLVLSWTPDPGATFAVHAGSLAALSAGAYDHDRVGPCGRTGPGASIPMPATDAYLLVTGGCGLAEGSYGRDSRGRERPESVSPCR